MAALFAICCVGGVYVNHLGLGGGVPQPDALHPYVVQFSRNAPRYLTLEEIKHFRIAIVVVFSSVIIFGVLLVLKRQR